MSGILGPIASYKIASGGGALPLDAISASAIAAFSTRKLRSAYAGSAIKVRRTSDNTTQDIGFSSDNLDTAALASFVGANSGYIDTWYDQSGNGNHLAIVGGGTDVRVVNAGSNITQNSKVCADAPNGSSTWYKITSSNVFQDSSGNGSLCAVFKRAGNSYPFIETDNVGTAINWYAPFAGDSNTYFRAPEGSANVSGALTWTSVSVGIAIAKSDGTMNVWQDGVNSLSASGQTVSRVTSGVTGLNVIRSADTSDRYCEFIFFPSALGSTDRTTYQSDAKTYWGTP